MNESINNRILLGNLIKNMNDTQLNQIIAYATGYEAASNTKISNQTDNKVLYIKEDKFKRKDCL